MTRISRQSHATEGGIPTSNIGRAFQNDKAFIPFITCGDPNLESIRRGVRAAAAAGMGLVELGTPFPDPMAEGPVIQAANLRTLLGDATIDAVSRMVAELCEELMTPFAFMAYVNVISSYDIARFAARAVEVGINGIILPDMPSEEKEEFASAFRAAGIDFIFMIALTSMARTREIATAAKGFLYVVSSLGVTGVWWEINTGLSGMFVSVRQVNPLPPAAIGFGISTPAQAKRMAAVADGVIAGSVIVRIMAEKGYEADEEIARHAREMKATANTFQ